MILYVVYYSIFCIPLQVSHHPPVSALYVTNRQEGFSVSATVLAKSKFYGKSLSSVYHYIVSNVCQEVYFKRLYRTVYIMEDLWLFVEKRWVIHIQVKSPGVVIHTKRFRQ